MFLTINYLRENFERFNKAYFEGELKTPSFEITHIKTYLGQYHWERNWGGELTNSIIRISDMYDRSEEDICNTLIHEMIHLYIRQKGIRDTRPHHGQVFNSIANRINREGGWHIARTDSIVGCGLRDKSKSEYFVALFYSGYRHRYFCMVINKNYVQYYKNLFESNPHHYVKPIIFRSDDDKAFAHYPQCRKRVAGYYTDKETYNRYAESDDNEFIYKAVVLSAA